MSRRDKTGALDEDLLPNWHILNGAACQWRLIAIVDQETPMLGLQRELWKSPVRGVAPRWCTPAESALLLSSRQTVALVGLLCGRLDPTLLSSDLTLALIDLLSKHLDAARAEAALPGASSGAERTIRLVWYRRPDGRWNADCACGATVCGILDEERGAFEDLHLRYTQEERSQGRPYPSCGPKLPDPDPNHPGPQVFR